MSQRLRANRATADIPIVCLSAQLGRDGPPPEMLADDCVAKPFAIDDLSAVVGRWARPSHR